MLSRAAECARLSLIVERWLDADLLLAEEGEALLAEIAAARRALRVRPVLAAGPTAACSAWLLHAMIDWDWQLPAATLPTLILVGALIAASEVLPSGPAPEPPKTEDVPLRELAAHAYPGPVSASRRD